MEDQTLREGGPGNLPLLLLLSGSPELGVLRRIEVEFSLHQTLRESGLESG